jgi:hypothetical protein
MSSRTVLVGADAVSSAEAKIGARLRMIKKPAARYLVNILMTVRELLAIKF